MSQEQQTAHPAAVAQEFMKRTDMKGGEVEAYAQTFNWLGEILAGNVVLTPKAVFASMEAELVELRKQVEVEEVEESPEELVELVGKEEFEEDIPVLEPLAEEAVAEAV